MIIDHWRRSINLGVAKLYQEAPSLIAEPTKSNLNRLEGLVGTYLSEKQYFEPAMMLHQSRRALGMVVNQLVLRMPENVESELILNETIDRLSEKGEPTNILYRGESSQNEEIRKGRDVKSAGGFASPLREATRNGFAGMWNPEVVNFRQVLGPSVQDLRVGIVGGGAAGIIAAGSLVNQGVQVKVYDPEGLGGIWKQTNENTLAAVYNNPRPVKIGDTGIPAGPGNGGVMRKMLEDIALGRTNVFNQPIPEPKQEKVGLIRRNGEQHEIVSVDGEVIGKHHVVIDSASTLIDRNYRQSRFITEIEGVPVHTGQQVLSSEDVERLKAENIKGSQVVIQGMGNSGIQMAGEFDRHGIDYVWITDIPQERLENVDKSIGGKPPVIRSVEEGRLTTLSVDLPSHMEIYNRALVEGRIKGGVRKLSILGEEGMMNREGRLEALPRVSEVWCLIGYDTQTIDHEGNSFCDYDGELRDDRGCFKLGRSLAVADPRHSNAAVVPGIVGQMPDLMAGVILRGAEFLYK